MTATLAFDPATYELPSELEATAPPEARGLRRDGVRLMVARGTGELEHRSFVDLPTLLDPGDVLVVNTSATIPASVPGQTTEIGPVSVQLAGQLPGGLWVVEVRRREGHPSQPGYHTLPWLNAEAGITVRLPVGGRIRLELPASTGIETGAPVRLWVAKVDLPVPVLRYLAHHGHPVRYSYVESEWPIEAYQTVFAEEPGSAEMPSAARPFSAELATRLISRGVGIVPFTLHCGVSSLEAHEPPAAEWFKVPGESASWINAARRRGHRVVAVGTTAVRALESVADHDGTVHAGEGWTEVVIGPDRPVTTVDGLITGWHEPGASHLALLEAVAGSDLVAASYVEALASRYLWHEFGDSHLILP